jgi:hypothetical protein
VFCGSAVPPEEDTGRRSFSNRLKKSHFRPALAPVARKHRASLQRTANGPLQIAPELLAQQVEPDIGGQ